ncbi:GNAT family N-acetyltransferase [Sphaerisporangium sp. NPDC051011]|uniref:GNAT family N-acetyltransferase n=1 Tax=Sphaerisporangium sp. NPDC051011 TaxID=3155792 RepID=UPI0033E06D41
MSHDVRVRQISDGDWDGIAALEADVYTGAGLSEGRAVLESRAVPSPGTCFLLECGRRPAGYVLALPYPMFRCPDLAREEERAFRSRNLHLHDLVIAEAFRGRGLARRLLRHLQAAARAKTYERISLVAVADSEPFWSAHGYRPHPDVGLPGGYGAHAVYMSAEVAA